MGKVCAEAMTKPSIDIGLHQVGIHSVRVLLTYEAGGRFSCPADNGENTIEIGLNDEWEEVFDSALHEGLEAHLTLSSCSFVSSTQEIEDPGAFLFVFSHNQFYQSCHAASRFIMNIQDRTLREWKKWNKVK